MNIVFYKTVLGWVQDNFAHGVLSTTLKSETRLWHIFCTTRFGSCTIGIYTGPTHPTFGMSRISTGKGTGLKIYNNFIKIKIEKLLQQP